MKEKAEKGGEAKLWITYFPQSPTPPKELSLNN
jgi:hypothetical protein